MNHFSRILLDSLTRSRTCLSPRHARKGGGAARIVILVQFKTYPMGDNDHFEINGLQRGNLHLSI